MDEPTDGTSDFLAAVRRAVVRAGHDFNNRHPWPWLRKYPPGAFNTVASITNKTITVAAAGEGVAATLSSVQATSLQYYKVLPSGKMWFARITAHTAGTAALTLDAAPETLAAGTKCTIVKDEYQLAADLGLFVDGLWTEDGYSVPLRQEEWIRKEFGDLPDPSWPPSAFCRIDARRIRLSHYPTAVKRVEYPYAMAPDDLDATDTTTELSIPHNYRWLLAEGALVLGNLLKSDKRMAVTKKDYEDGIESCVGYARRMLMGIGTNPGTGVPSPFL